MKSLSRILIIPIICLFALSGCAKDLAVGQDPGVSISTLTELPAPTGTVGYVVAPNDTLEIAVAQSEMLSGTYLTDGSGYITYPLLGRVFVSGKSPGQVSQMLADRLRGQYVIDPQVNVRPTGTITSSVSIGGEVKQAGNYPAATSYSLLRAINNAGGLDEYAKVDDVLVLRTVDNQRYIGVYNIQAIQRGNYTDPQIYPGDIITVGDSPGRRSLATILQFIPLLSTSVILFDRTFN